ASSSSRETFIAGMSAPRFRVAGSSTQVWRLSRVLRAAPAPMVQRDMRCVKSGPNTPLAGVPRMVWQLMQASEAKRSRPCRVVARGGPLGGDPTLELIPWMHHDHEEHETVLDAAVLGTLADVGPGTGRLDPHMVDLVRDHVHLARELGNPEAVDDVDGLEGD